MKKNLALLLLLGLYWFSSQSSFLYAQEEEQDTQDQEQEGDQGEDPAYSEGINEDINWDIYVSEPYSGGEKTFTLSAGTFFPTVFLNNNQKIKHNFTPPVGGSIGPLIFTYFLTSNIFVGGEASFMFVDTLRKNTLYMIPIGARAGWQFVFGRFEFPLYGSLGFAIHRYLDFGYFGLFGKLGAGAFYRFSPSWSFGINTDWQWYPQWPKDSSKNMDANIFGLTLAARYHFF
jgi:hypothetical protein